jgi:hypothetical protein
MADFPDSVKTFATLIDFVDDVLAEHQNERGAEITAIESYLLESATEVTVSSGVLTVTKSRHTVQPESGTSDEIDTITGIPDGGELVLSVADLGTDTLIFKHGTDNLSLPAETDITLTTGAIRFYRKGSTVYAQGGGGGGAQVLISHGQATNVPAASTRYMVPGMVQTQVQVYNLPFPAGTFRNLFVRQSSTQPAGGALTFKLFAGPVGSLVDTGIGVTFAAGSEAQDRTDSTNIYNHTEGQYIQFVLVNNAPSDASAIIGGITIDFLRD